MQTITKREVLILHKLLIETTGGSYTVLDFGRLDSALKTAFQTFDNKELYPTVQEKAARIGYSLITNHAFVDGNKRIATITMLAFLKINGISLVYSAKDLANLSLSLASGKYAYTKLLYFIRSHEQSQYSPLLKNPLKDINFTGFEEFAPQK